MKLNKSFSSPIIARHKGIKPPKKQRVFIQQTQVPRKKKVRAKKAAIDVALQESHDARKVCDSNVRRLKEAMNNFDKYTHAMERKEARLKRRRRATLAKLRHARDGPDRKLYKKILEGNHDEKIVEQVLNSYRNDLEKLWDNDGGVSWGEKNGKTFTIGKTERGSWIGKKIGFGSDEIYQGDTMYTDIAAVAQRNMDRWAKMPNRRAFDSSGPRIPATKLRPNDNVDTIGMQIRQSNLYWKGRNKGVKFHDVPRDTMAFTKTMERGSDKINSPRSTLDLSNTYWFPFKCTDERFPEPKFQYDTSGKEYKPKRLGTAMEEDDPDYYSSDDDEITIIQKKIPAHERTNSMALSALKAKLKGESSSFKDKCGRLNPTLTEVYPDLGWNFSVMKDEKHWSEKGIRMKTGPSGREDKNVFKPRYGCLGKVIMKDPRLHELKRDLHMNSPLILNDTAAKIYKDMQKKKNFKREQGASVPKSTQISKSIEMKVNEPGETKSNSYIVRGSTKNNVVTQRGSLGTLANTV